ncbi:hypothetical protein [Variovorax sp. YR750]|uniref:hypothetical protein n=1 Tax=Variovorax sp. YR750 TaxID=1884384 RepID=UPI000B86ED92|nr:hypothetical protein [Variovorax sp. YR750]
MYYALIGTAVAVFVGNLITTVIVLRSDFYSPQQKGLQLALVWLIPVIGAACCVSFAAVHRRSIPSPQLRFPEGESFNLPGGEANSL